MSSDCLVFETDAHLFVEKAMERLGISWSVVTVLVNNVDIKDNTYQTRWNVSESSGRVVKEYAEKIKAGEAFPMIVLEEKSNEKFRVVAGRHRASAYFEAQNGKTSYSAYLVDKSTPSELLFALSARENNSNGVRQDSSETARYAASKLLALGTHGGARAHKHDVVKSYAEAYGASLKTVKDNYYAMLVEKEMIRVGVNCGGVHMSALHPLWGWTQSAEWRQLASVVSEHRSLPRICHIIRDARRDKLDAMSLIGRIRQAALDASGDCLRGRPIKDPATVTLEHLSLALNDLRGLAAPANIHNELAEDISSMVEAIRLACKEWKSR
jgi:hypothetical protein